MILPALAPAPLAFHQLLQDPTNSHTRDLADANSTRARVRTVLRATKKDSTKDGRGADWSGAARVRSIFLSSDRKLDLAGQ